VLDLREMEFAFDGIQTGEHAMSAGERFSREPMYVQISRALVERVARGVWRPGGLLPNEIELARELGVSPGTVRKALDKLEADRIVVRRQGRGTFVLDHDSDQLALRFSRLIDEGGNRVGDRHTMLLAQELGPATSLECERLALDRTAGVVRTRRLREQDGRPCMHETTCLPMDRFGIKSVDEVGDYQIVPFAQKRGVHLVRAIEKVGAAAAALDIAELMGVQPGKMLLELDRVIYCFEGQPAEWRVSLCALQNSHYLAEMQ
jgi:GntR family transcriptional regulator